MVIRLTLKQKFVSIWKVKAKTIRPLVTSSLVLQFNLLFILLIGRVHGSTAKFDQAIFRLSGQVYFLSDLTENQKALKKLKCISGPSFTSQFLKVNLDQVSDLKLFDKTRARVTVKRSQLDPFIYLEKLKNTALGRTKEKLSGNELSKLSKSCAKITWKSLSIAEKAILLTEVYLRDRYSNSENLEVSFVELRKALDVKEDHEVFSLIPSRRLKKEILKIKESKEIESADDSLDPSGESPQIPLARPPEEKAEKSDGLSEDEP